MSVEVLDRHIGLDEGLPDASPQPQPRVATYLERPADSPDLYVYLHGMGLDAADFRPYMEADDTHSVALTLPGFTPEGAGQPPLDPVPLETHLAVVSWFLAHLGRQHPDKRLWLIGFSLGADMILRLCERWRGRPGPIAGPVAGSVAGPALPARPRLFAALLLDPNVNRSTMTLSDAFAAVNPDDPVPVLQAMTASVKDRREYARLCQYLGKVLHTKDLRQVQQHARDFLEYWGPAGDYGLISDRLGVLTATVPHSRVVFSGAYAPHVQRLQQRLATLPNFSYELLPPLDHFDLVEAPCLGPQLRRLREQTVGVLPRRRLAAAARARGA